MNGHELKKVLDGMSTEELNSTVMFLEQSSYEPEIIVSVQVVIGYDIMGKPTSSIILENLWK